MGTNLELVAAAESQLGKGYRITGCRCDTVCSRRDCSGEAVFSIRAAGVNCPCTSSFGLAQWGRAAGTLTTPQIAVVTPGILAIRNGFGSSNGPSGSNGHVVIGKGDGKVVDNQIINWGSTVEAMGTAYGIVRGPMGDRGFETFMFVPGIQYAPPAPEIDWPTLKKLVQWQARVTRNALTFGMPANGDITILNQLLLHLGFLPAGAPMNIYGVDTRNGVVQFKRLYGLPNDDGKKFGALAAAAILAPR